MRFNSMLSEVWKLRPYRDGGEATVIHYLVLIGLVVGASFGTGFAQTATPTPEAVVQDVDASKYEGWKKIEAKTFSFYGPQDLVGGQRRGIDTAVYRYENQQLRVSFDIGSMANPAPRYPTKEVVVEGRDAQIVHRNGQSNFHIQFLNPGDEFDMERLRRGDAVPPGYIDLDAVLMGE